MNFWGDGTYAVLSDKYNNDIRDGKYAKIVIISNSYKLLQLKLSGLGG